MWRHKSGNTTVGQYDNCVMKDMWSAAFTFSHVYKGECVELDGENKSFMSNIGCMTLCFCGVAFMSWKRLVAGGNDVSSGHFFVSEWAAQLQ